MTVRTVRIALAGVLLAGMVTGCAGEPPEEIFVNTLDSLARGTCRAAGNCEVQCPNGEPAQGRRSVCN